MEEQLRKLDDWDSVEKRGNAVVSPTGRGSAVLWAQGDQRHLGFGAKKAPPLMVVHFFYLVLRDMCRKAPSLPMVA